MIAAGVCLKDRYRLDRLLGRGGMASVWLATDEVLERPVAVKVLSDTIASDPEYLARFRREARIAASLSHPNLIGIYDYAEGSERPYLVMEHVSGGTLAERMASGGEVDCERLARELLGALGHIHAAGIVHRDVKPQNVLFAEDGSTRLIDFGIALPPDATALTLTGNLLGTARYIAPEVMHGATATEHADLYSCGIVLRDCVGEGQRGSLGALVGRLTSADPDRRPRSASEAARMIEDGPSSVGRPTERLTAMTQELPVADTPEPRPATRAEPRAPAGSGTPRPAARSPRPGWVGPVALLTVIAAIAVGAFALTGGGSDDGGAPDRAASGGPDASEATGGAAEEGESGSPAVVPEPAGEDPAVGSALNEDGFALIQEGRAEEAVPVLEEAVRAFPAGSEDLNYAYALFNLGSALRLSGRPEDAIPVLERRLAIPNQTETVRRELAAARAEASS